MAGLIYCGNDNISYQSVMYVTDEVPSSRSHSSSCL